MALNSSDASLHNQSTTEQHSNGAPAPDSWRKVSAQQFERPISGPEKFLKVMTDFDEVHGETSEIVTTILEYHTDQADVINAFRQAWLHMHNDFPQIAAPLVGNKRVYDMGEVKTKSQETFVVIEDKSLSEVFNEFGVMHRAWLYVFPQTRAMMLAASHVISDGRGHLYFLNEFLQRVAAILDGQLPGEVEWREDDMLDRLAPPLNVINPPSPSAEAVAKAQGALQEMGQYSDGLGIHDTDQPPAKARIQTVRFSEVETSAFVQAVKQRGATVSPAVHTAIATATNKFAGETKPNNGIISVDVRQYCGEYGGQPLTMYLGLPIRTVVDTCDFDRTLHAMVANYSSVHDDFRTGELAALQDQFWSFMKEGDQPPGPPERSIVDFSNLGVVEHFVRPSYGKVEIRRITQQCREMTRLIFLYFSTFRAKMHASIAYNERYHKVEEIHKFAKLFRSELLGGFGVAEDEGLRNAVGPPLV